MICSILLNKMNLVRRSFFGVLFFGMISMHAQSNNTKDLIDPGLDKRSNDFMDRQHEAFLEYVTSTLKSYPPSIPVAKERKGALYLLDAVLHDKYAEYREPVISFYHNRIEAVLNEIKSADVKEGAKIWKLYNMGFIIKTKSVTIAFDLVKANDENSEGFKLPKKIMSQIVSECDALFISHWHNDHMDKDVAWTFINQNKPVVAAEQLWQGDIIFNKITHLKREAHTKQKLGLKNNSLFIDVVVYPGHQMSKNMNNVPLVYTPEGISVSHMGDQINEGNFMIDYDWIDNVSKHHKVDILFPPNWTNELFRIVKGFNPKLVIPGHENELGHTVDDRVPFWGDHEYLDLTNEELYNSDYPVVQMTWGESFHYIPMNN